MAIRFDRRRRDASVLLLAAAACPRLARSQATPRVQRIAWLSPGKKDDAVVQRELVQTFRDALRELGRVEGRDHLIEFRFAEGEMERLPALAAELLLWGPELVVALGNRPAQVMREATRTLPILALLVDNPIELGFAASFARPGGNITGISSFGGELVAKRLQLARDLLPQARRIGILSNPYNVKREAFERLLQRHAPALGIDTTIAEAGAADRLEAAFAELQEARVEALLVLGDPVFWVHRERIAELCRSRRLPSIWGGRAYLDAGGLASYQSDFPAIFRRAAALADKLLKGADPAETPFEQATKLELAINLKAARALGITVPQGLLVAADHLIE